MPADPRFRSMPDCRRQRPRWAGSLSRAAHAAMADLASATALPASRVIEALLLSPLAAEIVKNYAKMAGVQKSTGA